MMAKVTSKFQVTVPRKIADAYAIRPGDEIDWVPAGNVIRVIPHGKRAIVLDRESRLRLFDQATERQGRRATASRPAEPPDRGWSREDLYGRGRAD
jgi:bifunctional DNA-binding transcriptional regulator/antitoxin component of YhaV-PrlF toxin-antitoxin module